MIRIRPAVEGDLEAIRAIYNREVETGTTTMDIEPRDERWGREWLATHSVAAYPVVVAEEGGVVVGWASVSPWSPRGGYAKTVEASVFVRDGARHKGVGRDLLSTLIDLARRAGHRVVLGRIETTNRASRALAVSLGFAPVGVMHRVGEKHGRVLDIELFELLLEQGRVEPA